MQVFAIARPHQIRSTAVRARREVGRPSCPPAGGRRRREQLYRHGLLRPALDGQQRAARAPGREAHQCPRSQAFGGRIGTNLSPSGDGEFSPLYSDGATERPRAAQRATGAHHDRAPPSLLRARWSMRRRHDPHATHQRCRSALSSRRPRRTRKPPSRRRRRTAAPWKPDASLRRPEATPSAPQNRSA